MIVGTAIALNCNASDWPVTANAHAVLVKSCELQPPGHPRREHTMPSAVSPLFVCNPQHLARTRNLCI